MSLEQFLKDKWVFLVMQIIIIGFIATMLTVFGVNVYGRVFVGGGIVVLNSALLVWEYIDKALYYRELQKNLDGLDKKRLITELIRTPKSQENKIWWEVLQLATKSMNDEVAKYRRLQEEYKTYIEAWIHEIKTPIACIGLINENHKSDVTRHISQEMSKVEGFVEQALFYARSTSVEKDYKIEEVNLENVVRGVIKRNARQMIENRVKLQLEPVDYKVISDTKWVDFMFGQVIANSLRYKKDTLTLTIKAWETEKQVFVALEDDGVGIPTQDVKRVFDKGFTGENGRSYGKSTGIGLYLCKKLCDKMYLGINLTSQEGKGTTVTFSFPKDKSIFFEEYSIR